MSEDFWIIEFEIEGERFTITNRYGGGLVLSRKQLQLLEMETEKFKRQFEIAKRLVMLVVAYFEFREAAQDWEQNPRSLHRWSAGDVYVMASNIAIVNQQKSDLEEHILPYAVSPVMQEFAQLVRAEVTLRRARRRREEQAETGGPGYVYVLKLESGKCKIGRTDNPERRMQEFRRQQLPSPIIGFIVVKYVPNMFATEKRLHAEFEAKQSHNEWFSLAPLDIAIIREMLDKAGKTS